MDIPENNIKQYIVVDKSLEMSYGKFAAQVSHASMAFLAKMIQQGMRTDETGMFETDDEGNLLCSLAIDPVLYGEWLGGIFTKVVLAAKNGNQMLKVIERAKEAGLVEGTDFFVIRDACLTELEPDETGSRLTAIGFAPMDKDKLAPVVGKLQLYRK